MKETRKPRADDKFCGISRIQLFLLALSLAFIGKTMTGAYLNSMYTQIEKQFNIPASLVGIINGSFEIECEKEPGSMLWLFVMFGNLIRGMGETPIVPLGVSYLEDFAKTENSPFYQGCLHTSTVIGPFLGFLLASFCAKLFVDLEYVDAGVYNIPIICLGYFFGGLFMKKFKINTYQAAHIAFWVTFLDYLLYFIAFWTICDTSPVAGLTVTYEGKINISDLKEETMDKIITTGKFKDKPPYQDSNSTVVPAKFMCHNCSKLKIFLGALAFSFFAKGFSGSYMKSMSSQIERRFEISSSIVGIIDGSFELGGYMPGYLHSLSAKCNPSLTGLVRSSGMFGPTLGFLLGSFCASLWVDIGVVDTDAININPKDTRWVGAWWLGLLICGAVNFIASLPFFFLPYSLTKEGEDDNPKKISHLPVQGDHCKTDPPAQPQLKFSEAVKDFLPTLKKLFGNPVFLVYVLLTILQYNSLVGLITYETKFMEQQFNVSVAKAIFLVGVILLPITILGMFLGGYLIKKFKLHITGMAKFACISFIVAYLLNLLYFLCNCEVLQLAGLTVPYSGSVSPDLKSFAVGIETLGGRILGGLPAPIYFGALIDETCLKWGTKSCGGSGSCRIYDTKAFRNVYLGLIAGLRAGCCVLYMVLCVLIMRRFKADDKEMTDIKNAEEAINKESVTVNKKETLPGAKTSEESEETYM
ncbi:hypothetical protein ASZ78_012914 [Callipepla squamata]|uniref:Solute carrier organic anion transporter family member n=1 Tax=Callipepla squamata TaxID=9009 RepID=A0A226N7T5_CALSU|nr:hypothetical protein ASZ78_012914 [Callipepla squamata]